MDAGLIILIVNLVFLGFLLIGFLRGLRRGIKRAALHLAFVAVAIVVAYFATRPITEFVLGLNIIPSSSGTTSIGEMIATSMGDVSGYSQTLVNFVGELPVAIASPIVFMLVLIVVQFVLWIIFMIVARICFKTRKYEKKNNIKRHRFWGALVGTVDTLAFLVFLFMPITSLTNTVGELAYVSSELQTAPYDDENHQLYTTGQLIRQNVPELVLEIVDGYNSSYVGKVVHLGGFGHKMFDGLSYVTVDNTKIKWRGELTNLAGIYNKTVEILSSDNDLTAQDVKNLSNNANQLLKGNLLTHVISPIVSDIFENFDTLAVDFEMDSETYEMAKAVIDNLNKRFEKEEITFAKYIENNFSILIDVVNSLAENGALDTLTHIEGMSDVVDILTEDTLSKVVPQLSKIMDMTLVEDVYDLFSDMVVESMAELEEYINVDGYKDYGVLKADVKNLLNLVIDVSKIKSSETAQTNILQDIFNGEEYDLLAIVNDDSAVDIISKITGIKGLENTIVKIFNMVDDQILTFIDSLYDSEETINYQFERTITDATDKSKFTASLSSQAQSFVDLARLALKDDFGSLSDIGAILDIIKNNIVNNNFDKETLSSDGVFAAMFRNLYNVLNGTVTVGTDEHKPIFAQHAEFEALIDSMTEKELKPGDNANLKYYIVDYTKLFTNLDSAVKIAGSVGNIKEALENIDSDNIEDLVAAFADIINDVGVEEIVDAVDFIVGVLEDIGEDYNISAQLNVDEETLGYIEDAIEDVVNSLKENEELDISEDLLNKLEEKLKGLFKTSSSN